ncbi:head decoration protein [Acidovorax sp. GBBC 3332]|nr:MULTISPECIES: head decoration protein [unclassified Acidovorax]MDA8449832.1 head decoration protein [Acidovorax sp. GBBC 3297]MDA8459277.1 head decoration protein [Acidovorax sp. GBBC 3333]MDA8464314.1 head decoration protein [Acidovorax sp. GBBC 3332]MDA8469476.1 head decoration protein [Acidovorax sp. GBBC 3299]
MPTYTQPKTIADLLIVEVAPGWTKERNTFTAGAVYPFGTVLAKVNTKVLAIDPAGTGAAKVPYAVAAETVKATAADTVGLTIARGATVDADELVWPAGITDAQKAAAIAGLEARGIVAITRL